METQTKRCTNCTRGPQPLSEFEGKFGPTAQCLSCRTKCKKRDAKRHADPETHERIKEQQRENKYYQTYRERKQSGQGSERKHNLDQTCGWRNTDKCRGRLAHWKRNNLIELLGQYKRSAENRWYAWSLTDDEAQEMMTNHCVYCGFLDLEDRLNGIDRIDNSKGYTLENTCSACKHCNNMKYTWSVDEFLAHVKRIVNPVIDESTKKYATVRAVKTLHNNATTRNIDVYASDEYLSDLMNTPCHYCGIFKKLNGVDRVDSYLGYCPSNIVPCCSPCNLMKKNLNIDDFLAHTKRITEFQEMSKTSSGPIDEVHHPDSLCCYVLRKESQSFKKNCVYKNE